MKFKFWKKKNVEDSRNDGRFGMSKAETDIMLKYKEKKSTVSYNAKYELYPFARKLVELPIKDLFQIGYTLTVDTKDEKLEGTINKMVKHLNSKIHEAWTIARVQGNAAMLLVLDDEEPNLDINYNKLKENSLINVIIYKDDELSKSIIENNPLNINFGEAKSFRLNKWGNTLEANHTRCLNFIGDKVITTDPFSKDGVSVLKKSDDVLSQEHSVIKNIGGLVRKANVDHLKIPDYYSKLCDERDMYNSGTRTTEYSVDEYISKSQRLLNNENILVTDAEISLDRNSINFNGLTGISDHYIEILAGLEDIPLERFASKTQASLNNSGGNNLENYYSKLKGMQAHQLQPTYDKLNAILSAMFGVDVTITCKDPHEQSKAQKLDNETKVINNAVSLINTGLAENEEIQEYFNKHGIEQLNSVVTEYNLPKDEE